MSKCTLYARVSSTEPERGEYSIDAQGRTASCPNVPKGDIIPQIRGLVWSR